MGWAVLSAPGTQFGPCADVACGHIDCNETRLMSSELCDICVKPIGYETRFYQRPSKALVHVVCLEKEERQIAEAQAQAQARAQASQVQIACPPATPATPSTSQAAPHFVAVYWTHFWNRQRYTTNHLFRDYPERGYQNVSPEEGRSLCGLDIPSHCHVLYEYTLAELLNGKGICKRCQKIACGLVPEGVRS